MDHCLARDGIKCRRQVRIPIQYDDLVINDGFRADIIVEDKVLLELKSVASVHCKQVLTYIRLSSLKLGILINFNESYLKNGIKRIANGL